jgi:hypothetical protein
VSRRAATVLVAALVLAGTGCGGDDEGAGELRWTAKPKVYAHPTLRQDRFLSGQVENDGLRPLEVKATDVRLVDADGKRVNGVAVFLRGYLHTLYPPTRDPLGGIPKREQVRTGRLLVLAPGKRSYVTFAWRVPRGGKQPVRAEYGKGSLPIPSPSVGDH